MLRQGEPLVAVSIFLFLLLPSVEMPDEDGQRRAQEGLEEGSVEVDDRKDPVERVDNNSDEFEDLI